MPNILFRNSSKVSTETQNLDRPTQAKEAPTSTMSPEPTTKSGDLGRACDIDPDSTNYSDYKVCFDNLVLTKLDAVLKSLKERIPLVPRLGAAAFANDTRRRILLGFSAFPEERFSDSPDAGAALVNIAAYTKAHGRSGVAMEKLKDVYGSVPGGPTILHDFLNVCPMYEFARYMREEAGTRVYLYVFGVNSTPRIPPNMHVDHYAFIHEPDNFVRKRIHVNFRSLLGSFIHNTPNWPEWEPYGAHMMFTGTARIVRGFRERICDGWRQIFKYQGVKALL